MSTNEERAAYLNRVLSGTVNSIVQYVEISAPYVAPDCAGHAQSMERMRHEETVQAQVLDELVLRCDGVPTVEAFPYWNIDLNYLDLRFMARFAAKHEETVIAEMESGLDSIKSDPVCLTKVQGILEEKRRHLELLREIGTPPEPPKKPEAKAEA